MVTFLLGADIVSSLGHCAVCTFHDAICNSTRHYPHKGVLILALRIFVRLYLSICIRRIRTAACGGRLPVYKNQLAVFVGIIGLIPAFRGCCSKLRQNGSTCANYHLVDIHVCGNIKKNCVNVCGLFILHAEICIVDRYGLANALAAAFCGYSAGVRERHGLLISQSCINDSRLIQLGVGVCDNLTIPQLERNLISGLYSCIRNNLFWNIPCYGEVVADVLLCKVGAAANGNAKLCASLFCCCQCLRTDIIVPVAGQLVLTLHACQILCILGIRYTVALNIQTAAVHDTLYIFLSLQSNAQRFDLHIRRSIFARSQTKVGVSELMAVQRKSCLTDLALGLISAACFCLIIFFAAGVARCQIQINILQLQRIYCGHSCSAVAVVLEAVVIASTVCAGIIHSAGVLFALGQIRICGVQPVRCSAVAGISRAVCLNGNQRDGLIGVGLHGIVCRILLCQTGIAVLHLEFAVIGEVCIRRNLDHNGEFCCVRRARDCLADVPVVAVRLIC